MDKLVIDVVDYDGNKVILTEKKWKQKFQQHPELLSKTFLKNLEDTIKNPNEVWEDYSDKENKRCYYKKYSPNSYVKAVIWITASPCHIVSAFETNKIKEETYQPNIKRIK
ncbi:MAG: PBECR2 nuclease fold domain-containing protein [Patescibacteria group bacterium]